MDSSSNLSSKNVTKWKENLQNLLTKSKICGICLCEEADMDHWDTLLNIAYEKRERLLKDIISGTFGIHIKALLPTKYLCKGCVTTILQAYCLIRRIKTNHSVLKKCESLISQQFKSGSKLDQLKEKELLLTIDNIDSLNVPTMITQPMVSVTQIFVCEIDDLDESEVNFNFEDLIMKYECPYCGHQFPNYTQFKDHYSLHKDIYYRCKRCLKRFKLFKDLVNHRKNMHKELSLYNCDTCKIILLNTESVEHVNDHILKNTCQICNIIFETKSALDDHKIKLHPQSHSPFLCEECGDIFSTQLFLDVHRRTHKTVPVKNHSEKIVIEEIIAKDLHNGSYEIKCTSCGEVLNSEEAYKIHKSKQNTKCEVCRKGFCTLEQLNNHIQAKHPNRPTASKNDKDEVCTQIATNLTDTQYFCKECREIFDCVEDYNVHMQKHDKECPVCFKKYSRTNLARHIKRHNTEIDYLNIKTFACDICEEKFITERALKKHLKQHIVLKNCPHCNKNVNSVFYRKHLKTHKQEKNELKSCTECNYKTKFATCMEGHMNRIHLKTRPYKCGECDKTFYSSFTLKGHKTTHYTSRPEFLCNICNKKFLSQKALTYHIRLHTGEKTHPCSMCDMSFVTASRRQQHVIRKHYDPSYECEHCQKKFFTKSDLRRHIGDCHDGEYKRKKNYRNNVIKDGHNYALVNVEMIVEDPDGYELKEDYQVTD